MASGEIPCSYQDLKNEYANVENLIPAERKQQRAHISQGGGELHDPWATKAERHIVRDLKKFATPLHLSDFQDLSSLTDLKVYKVLEILNRMNFAEKGDKFDAEADRYRLMYLEELEGIPVETTDGANVSSYVGLTRVS